ncbi:UNVERIFIED_CONTAM: hypothetical protein Slati_3214600 [Sesamum latifolium]|uniref:Uncharacterized protein n=1 Tax=Sesamum latifolium TaxID=2727402 RepID=A0AAW2UXZ1_9LAMI
MEGGDDHLHLHRHHHHHHHHHGRPNFPFQLLEKKEDESTSSAAYPSLAISADISSNPSTSTTPRSTTSASSSLQIAATTAAEPSKKPPPSVHQPKIATPRLTDAGGAFACRHSALLGFFSSPGSSATSPMAKPLSGCSNRRSRLLSPPQVPVRFPRTLLLSTSLCVARVQACRCRLS